MARSQQADIFTRKYWEACCKIPIGPDKIQPNCEKQRSPDEEQKLPAESEILRDKNVKEIFVRKVLKSDNIMNKSAKLSQNTPVTCFAAKEKNK